MLRALEIHANQAVSNDNRTIISTANELHNMKAQKQIHRKWSSHSSPHYWPKMACMKVCIGYMYHWSHDRMTSRRFALRIQMYIIVFFLWKSSISHLRRRIVRGCWRRLLLLLIRCCAVAFISGTDLVTLAISYPHAENEGWEKQAQQGQIPQVRTRPIRGFIIWNAT